MPTAILCRRCLEELPLTPKSCAQCHEVKNPDQFYTTKSGKHNQYSRLSSYCKDCARDNARASALRKKRQ